MTRPEYDRFYGDRLLGLLMRAFADVRAICERRRDGAEIQLMDAARFGEVMSQLMRDGYALRDEIWKQLMDSRPVEEKTREQAQPPAKAGPQNGQSKPTTGAQGKPS